MKHVGLILIIVGVLALLIGLVICFNTLTSDYASSTCAKAESDKSKYDEARRKCNSGASDESMRKYCFERETIGLTGVLECESKTSFMTKQLIMGIVPAVIGFLLAIVGFFLRRRKAVV